MKLFLPLAVAGLLLVGVAAIHVYPDWWLETLIFMAAVVGVAVFVRSR
jgi:hypothetical protein